MINGTRLKKEINWHYGTQSAFADAAGWTQNKVSKLVNGRYTPDVDEAERIAKLLDLSIAGFAQIFLPGLSPNGDGRHQTT